MVWLDRNHNEPRFELVRLEHRMGRGLRRAYNRAERPVKSRVEADRRSRRQFAGRFGEWPVFKPHERRNKAEEEGLRIMSKIVDIEDLVAQRLRLTAFPDRRSMRPITFAPIVIALA